MRFRILTSSRSNHIGNGLTYESGDLPVREGCFVSIPLRKGETEGIVMEVERAKQEDSVSIREIAKLLTEEPLIPDAHLQTLRWMSAEYFCTLRSALSVFLPPPPWTRLLPPEEWRLFLFGPSVAVRGAKQQAIVEYLSHHDGATLREIRDETGASTATISALLERGSIRKEKMAGAIHDPDITVNRTALPSLTKLQEEVYTEMSSVKRPSLLFGVTASGKTEIYARMIADAVESGGQAILLVPEILLTEHFIHRFEDLLADRVAILHSRLGQAGRAAAWRRARNGNTALIIGSRSALFAPLPNLKLVILDEEHEWTYKNEQTPRYHARETAVALCRFAKAKLVLGSATPSVESWARAKNGQFHLARLPERFGSAPVPTVRVIDLGVTEFGKSFPFSPPLLDAIDERLKRGEQSILFLNRKGIGSALLCMECRRRVTSPTSQLPFSVHRRGSTPMLVDHSTGEYVPLPTYCPSCRSLNLRIVGAGTMKLEDQISAHFPHARVLRADSDTMTSPDRIRSLLESMRNGGADILLGTQTVVKGLDLPNVTLAAVLIADVGLSLPHFRAGERVFQLLAQLTGRSGRAKIGEVYIQTYRPDALEVRAAATHRTEEFLDGELALRLRTGYPPATRMLRLILRGPDASSRARALLVQAQIHSQKMQLNLHISCAPTLFGGGREWHILLRGEAPEKILATLPVIDAVCDIDPLECV